MIKQKAIIFDIDMVLADCTHRLHYITPEPIITRGVIMPHRIEPQDVISFDPGFKKDYNAFYDACVDDSIIEAGIELVNGLQSADNVVVLFLTGRPERIRKHTIDWLHRALGVDGIATPEQTTEFIYMRADGDHRPDYEYKAEQLVKILAKYDVICAIDDSPKVIEMYKSYRIFTLQAPRKSESV